MDHKNHFHTTQNDITRHYKATPPPPPLFIGGTIAHLLAVDYSLKPVLTALGARHILGGVYAVDQAVDRLPDGGYQLSEDIKTRLETSLEQLNDELHWHSVRKEQR